MADKWQVHASCPPNESLPAFTSLLLNHLTALSFRGDSCAIAASTSVESQRMRETLVREIGKTGLKVVQAGEETAGTILLYDWEEYQSECEEIGAPNTTIAMLTQENRRESIDRSQLCKQKASPETREIEEKLQLHRALEPEMKALAGQICHLVAERLQPMAVPEGKRGLDVGGLKEKFTAALGRIQTQVEALTVEAGTEFDITEDMRKTTLQHQQLLTTLQSLCTSDLDQTYMSDLEEQLESLEKPLRMLFVHIASLKSQKRPRRPPFKLVQIASDSGDLYMAVYNRTGERVDEVMVCALGKAGETEPLQPITVEKEVTLLDLKMLALAHGEEMCLANREGPLSNIVRVNLEGFLSGQGGEIAATEEVYSAQPS